MSTATEQIEEIADKEYQYGFVTDIESDTVPVGLNEDVIRLISAKKNEPEWLLEWRLKAYRHWLTMAEPLWHNVNVTPIDYQNIIYYSAPKPKKVAEQPGRSRPGAAGDVREAGHLAGRAEAPDRRRRGRRLRQRLRRHHVQGRSWPRRASSSARSRKRCRSIPTWCASISARSCPTRTTTTRR